MDMQTTKVRGKFFTVVRDGAPVVHITRKYLTRRMAEAAAKCWVAFHGGETKMMGSLVKSGERFKAMTERADVGRCWREFSSEYVTEQVAWYAKYNIAAVRKTGPMGEYIEIGRNGSSYAQYHVMTADAPVSTERNVMLSPNDVETKTRPEFRGIPSYFGKVEWFDVFDRATNDILTPWQVARVDSREIVVNGPKGLIETHCRTLREAAEFIHRTRI